MGWTLSQRPVSTFRRNALATVVVQLRFHPILKLVEQYADFQEKVRLRFPMYEAVETQSYLLAFDVSAAPTALRTERVHRFASGDGNTVVALDNTSVTIEYANYQDRASLLEDVSLVLDVLRTYSPVPVRLGLRYVNVIEQKKLEAHFGTVVPWHELLAPDFAKVPGGLASIDPSTNYYAEVTSSLNCGKMTVRYGLLSQRGSQIQHFRLDTDRFIEAGVKIEEVSSLLMQFSDDIFQVFMKAAGPKLIEWMEAGDEPR